jgi:acyl-CoA synthetase (AMP-forming)/AMP-acid ligase II
MDRKENYKEYLYSKLWNDIKSYAEHFKNLGVQKGDVVSIMLPTCEEYLAAFFGAQLIHAIPVSLYPPSSLSDLDSWTQKTKEMILSVQSKLLITNLRISAICNKLVKESNIDLSIIENVNLQKVVESFDIELFNKDDICFLQFSSGTTGSPKAITITNENTIINSQIIADSLPVNNKDIKLASWLPLYHDMGLVGCLLMSIINGTDIILIRPEDFIVKPSLWLKAIHDFRVTVTTAPNFAYGLVQKRVEAKYIESLDLSCLQASLCGSEVVYKETMEKFINHLLPAGLDPKAIIPVYGMAETTLAVSFTNKEKGMKFIKVNKSSLSDKKIVLDQNGIEICSVGELLPTFSVKIIDDNENELQENQVGRILLKGPCISSGYYLDEEKTKTMFIDNWLDTGDEGFIYNNEIYICGRIKDTMIIRGRNYYPTSYEEKLYNIEGIRKGRAIVSSSYNKLSDTEEVVVLAEAASSQYLEHDIELNRIKKEITLLIQKEGLPIFKVDVFLPGVLLKTSSGKLKRRENIRLWEENKIITRQTESALRKSIQMFMLYSKTIQNKISLRK